MKILYIASELDKCGASKSLFNLIKGMKELGNDVSVVAPSWNLVDKDYVESLKELSVSYYLLPIFWDIKSDKAKVPSLFNKIKFKINCIIGRIESPKNRGKKFQYFKKFNRRDKT